MPDYVKLKTSYISEWQICFTYYDEQKHHYSRCIYTHDFWIMWCNPDKKCNIENELKNEDNGPHLLLIDVICSECAAMHYQWGGNLSVVTFTFTFKPNRTRLACEFGANPFSGSRDIWFINKTRMWANAQRDGRPAEFRWRTPFNAAKFGWRPLLECRAVTAQRRETRWNLQGCVEIW